MKKLIKAATAAAILSAGFTAFGIMPAAAETNDVTTITADKVAQWTNQEANTYTGRIHGWKDWENAVYIGFSLSDFKSDALTSAELVVNTNYIGSGGGTGYVYSADYSVFTNNGDYTAAPGYNTTELSSYTIPTATGSFSIDVTDYIKTLSAGTANAAFRLDVKSQNNSCNWCIDTLSYGTAPKLVLTYDNTASSPITNADFSDSANGWTLSGGKANVKNGALEIKGNNYTQTVSQTVTGLDAGTYDLTLDVTNSAIGGTYYAYAKTAGHTAAMTALPQTSEAITVTVPGITTDNGTIEIGVYAAGSSTVTLDNFKLSASASSRLPFLKGGEISKLTYVEDKGGKFYRADGTEADALQIMAENGFNLARIRLLNDPGKGHGDGTYYLPAGYQTIDDCLALARRAKAKGMKIEFTFAYSDYWVDGDKQIIPHEWQEEMTAKGITTTAAKVNYLEAKVEAYTTDVLQQLVAQGTTPDYVSIGNEMQSGMFFGTGYEGDLYYKKDYMLRFVNAGARAVREVCPNAKVVIHSDNGGKVFEWLTSSWDNTAFQYLLKNADYDVMAVSYYPYYNADISIDKVVEEFNYCVNTLNKDVMIMESGYNFAEKRSDGYEGQLENNGYYQNIYGETIAGQRAYLTELYNKLKAVSGGRCIGVSYWDPVMITDKVGWAIKEDGDYLQGNVISNSTIFDFKGKAVDGQLAMKYNTNASDKILITGKLTQDDKPLANGTAELTINGASYTVTSDAYGDYIAAVSYPAGGEFKITAESSEDNYTKPAPTDGVLVSGVNFTIAAPEKPQAKLEAANWTAADNSGYTANGNILTRGTEKLYGYMATLKSDGYTYKKIMAEAVSAAGKKSMTEEFSGASLSGDGSVIFYIISNAELDTENSRVYCE